MSNFLNPSADLALTMDIGGTKMRASLISREGKVVRVESVRTAPREGIEPAQERLLATMRSVLGDEQVAGVALASAGPMYPDSGAYNHPPSLHTWHGKSMKPYLERELGATIHFGHDATLAAYGEQHYGRQRGADPLLYLTVSTGVGGGLVAKGRMVTGATGLAGEFGHTIVYPDGERNCGIRCRGCLEGLCSGTSIAHLAQRRYVNADPGTALLTEVDNDLEIINSEMVFRHAAAGDPIAARIVSEAQAALGIAIASWINSLDLAAVVVGGGVAQSLRSAWPIVLERVSEYALPHFVEGGELPIHITELGDEISMLGAAAHVFKIASDPGHDRKAP